jgi:antitoxin FitA
MRTIQVREIPDDTYDTIRERAKAEGKSLQSYMREQVIALARRPSKREVIGAIEEALADFGPVATSATAISDDARAERH